MRALRCGILLVLAGATCAVADSTAAAPAAELESLRQEVRELRRMVEALQLLLAQRPSPAPTTGRSELQPSPPRAPVPAAPTWKENLQNPAISVVFQAIGNSSLSREDDANGFDLSEAEVSFQSTVDPFAKVDVFLAFPSGESPEVEEGFATTMSLPGSLQLRGGRYKARMGKWNGLHQHAFFTVDRPDALTSFLGDESLAFDGVSLSLLIPNPWDLYIESVTEVGTALEGNSFNGSRRNLSYLEHLAALLDLTPNATLEVGWTAALGSTGPSETLETAIEDAELTGTVEPLQELDSSLQGIDVTYKWKPLARNYRSFLWQTEVLHSRQDRQTLNETGALELETISSLGAYSYSEYQFAKRWRAGTRFDLSGVPDSETARMWAGSAVLRFQPSEFQEIRFQFKHTRRNEAAALRFGKDSEDSRVFLEWIPVIGAHGAHKY